MFKTFRFPFVSRDRHDEMISAYEKRLAEVTADLHKWQDRFAEIYTLKPLHEKEGPVPVPVHVQYDEMTDFERARLRVGPRAGTRAIMAEMQREKNREYERERGSGLDRADEVAARNHGQTASIDIDAVIADGRAAAQRGNA